MATTTIYCGDLKAATQMERLSHFIGEFWLKNRLSLFLMTLFISVLRFGIVPWSNPVLADVVAGAETHIPEGS